MFQNKAFNGNISTWDTKNVSDMAYMFSGATTFNKDISAGMLIMLSTMERMFENASKFNSPIFKLVNQKLKICNICSTMQKNLIIQIFQIGIHHQSLI
ncbi:BspA family leucine-rich repeat surface protein [Mycoplasmopsis bovis]|nr:BspA family leucine-rich repeat surface protein [Mycoplasmopsis bovis]QQH37481.1 BspA family leucine-rich repeat surface protein [Mycoplasmopsis bovis]